MSKRLIGTLVTALLTLSTAAFSAVKEGGYSFSPLIGGYKYSSNQQFNSSLVLGVRGGYNVTKAIGVEGLYDYVQPTDSKKLSLKDVSMQRFGVQGLYYFIPDNQLVPYVAGGLAGVKFSGSGINPQTHVSFDYGAGAKYFVTDNIAVRADLRHILYGYNNTSFSNFEFMFGTSFQFGGVASIQKTVIAEAAAPASVHAPESVPVACASMSEPVGSVPVQSPVVCAPIETIRTVVAPATREACEPFLIASATPELPAVAVAIKACSKPADITVLFSYEKSDIKQKYYDELDRIGDFLRNFPGAKATIEGHASAGDKDVDLKLSQARADNAKSHLMYKFGIDASRITAKGYGLTRPVASNKTARGRIQNRRIVAMFSCE